MPYPNSQLRILFALTPVSIRPLFNLTLGSLKIAQSKAKTKRAKINPSGGPAAPRKPTKWPKLSEKQTKAYQYHGDPLKNHQGDSIVSQNSFSSDSAKKVKRQTPRARAPER